MMTRSMVRRPQQQQSTAMTRSKQQSSNVTADRVTTTVRARMSDMVTHRKAARLQHPTLIYAQPRLIMHAMLKSAMLPRSLHAARRCSTKSEMSAKTLCRPLRRLGGGAGGGGGGSFGFCKKATNRIMTAGLSPIPSTNLCQGSGAASVCELPAVLCLTRAGL